jgi:hypothetical protein
MQSDKTTSREIGVFVRKPKDIPGRKCVCGTVTILLKRKGGMGLLFARRRMADAPKLRRSKA